MSFMISVLFMTFFTTFAARIAIGLPTKASQIEASTTMLTTAGFSGSKGMKMKISYLVTKCSFMKWYMKYFIYIIAYLKVQFFFKHSNFN